MENLKSRIIPEHIYEEAVNHEKNVNDEYLKRMKTESDTNGDPYERELVARSFILELENWRAKETLRFYTKLAEKHNL